MTCQFTGHRIGQCATELGALIEYLQLHLELLAGYHMYLGY